MNKEMKIEIIWNAGKILLTVFVVIMAKKIFL